MEGLAYEHKVCFTEAQIVRIVEKQQKKKIGAVRFALNKRLLAIPKPHWL